MSVAGTTTWINPNGGAWNDATNWSNGVPTSADAVALPELDSEGYEIVLDTATACSSIDVTGHGVSIIGPGPLTVSSIAIASARSEASLAFSETQVTAFGVLVGGAGGQGTLTLSDDALLGGGSLNSGVGASNANAGAIAVLDGGRLVMAQVMLGNASSLTLQARSSGPTLTANALDRNGSLHLLLPDGAALPTDGAMVLLSWASMTGSFDVIDPLSVAGYTVPVTSNNFTIIIGNCDPIVGLEVRPTSPGMFVGFSVPIETYCTKVSGLEVPLFGVNYELLDPSTATFTLDEIMPVSGEPIGIVVSTTTYGVPIAETAIFQPSVSPPLVQDRIDVSVDGDVGNGSIESTTWSARVTPDGRHVAFLSSSTNIVDGAPGLSFTKVFVKDRWTGEVERIDVEGGWNDYVDDATDVDLSDDGRYVVFIRPVGPNWFDRHVWLRDRLLGTTRLVSAAPDGSFGNGGASSTCISGDGRLVAYTTRATNIVPGAAGTHWLVVGFDVELGTSSTLSVSAGGDVANGSCEDLAVNVDGRYVLFSTSATNLISDNAGAKRLLMLDRWSGSYERVDVGDSGGGNGASIQSAVSADGRVVVFASTAENLPAIEDGNKVDVFVRDRELGTTTCLSDNTGEPASYLYAYPNISADGSTALIGRLYGMLEVGVLRRVDLSTGASEVVIEDPWGAAVPLAARRSEISADGTSVFFAATDGDVVPFGAANSGLFVRRFGSKIEGDITGDGLVNAADLALLLAAWGTADASADIDHDGSVGAGDLALLLAAWNA